MQALIAGAIGFSPSMSTHVKATSIAMLPSFDEWRAEFGKQYDDAAEHAVAS